MSATTVSIVIPVYNAGRHLAGAIGSMIEQSYSDWEMICIDDGSTDGSGPILDWFATIEPRIRVVHQQNAGIVAALNHGCSLAHGEWICRMDADDLSIQNRIETQVRWLQSHPQVIALGASILEMDADGSPLGVQQLALEHEDIERRLLTRRTGLFHPTAMIRADAMRSVEGYRKSFEWVEDHDLWLRLSRVGQLANLDTVLLCYRQHASSVCWQRRDRQRALMNQLMIESHAERGLSYQETNDEHGGSRSLANAGKWARKAIRGGHVATAVKHLRMMWREQGATPYALRMTAEVALRSIPALARGTTNLNEPRIPELNRWEQQISQAGLGLPH